MLHFTIRNQLLLLLSLLVLVSCDTGGAGDLDVSGRWVSVSANAILGRCCDFELLVDQVGSRVNATGEVRVPTPYIGQSRVIAVTGSGLVSPSLISVQVAGGASWGTIYIYLDEPLDRVTYRGSIRGSWGTHDSLRVLQYDRAQ